MEAFLAEGHGCSATNYPLVMMMMMSHLITWEILDDSYHI